MYEKTETQITHTYLYFMKTNEFKEIIRQLVKEELRQELPREVAREVIREVQQQLPKLLFEMLGQKPVSKSQLFVNEDIASDPDASLQPRRVPTPMSSAQPQKKVIKRYTKDPMLNAILNETTPGLPQTPYVETGVPLPNFNKIGVSDEFKSEMREILNEATAEQQTAQENVEESGYEPNRDVSRLFNKNFKAILNKSKEGHNGNFSGMIQNW